MMQFQSQPEYSRRCKERRRGQALLLAVLVMVFVSLIGATFITVVATNIGQTQRSEEKDKARQAAQAGLAFVNLQLTEGELATQWRPTGEVMRFNANAGAPQNGDPDYSTYWTPFDQAQGWATDGQFVKFPDPRSINPNLNAPNYMVKVEKVVAPGLPGDIGDNQNNDKTGALRITTIGLSPDEPSTFFKSIAYKGGPAQSPLTGAMRSVSNWDFVNEVVPSAKTSSSGSGINMPISSTKGNFPGQNFYISVGDPGSVLRNAYVTSASSTSLTLATSLTWSAGERVEIAAALGAPLAVDYNKDGIADTTSEKIVFDVSNSTTPGSTYINGSAIFSGNTFLQNLRDPQASAGGTVGKVRVTGLIQVADIGATKVAGTYSTGAASGQQTLVDSSDPNFPFSGGGILADGIISDNANGILNSIDPTRQNKPFTPANLMSGSGGFGRFMQMSKYSQDASYDALNDSVTDSVQSGAYGWAEGIYINNPQDKERVFDTSQFREMNSTELQALLFSKATDTTKQYLRLSTPALKTDAARSLEEQHLRGWVSPSEFRARGAMIELDPDNARVIITRESITDGRGNLISPDATLLYNNEGPVPSLGWRTPNGDLAGDTTYGGVYQQTLPWPANGVIFAEGNIRIRGTASNSAVDVGRSLTVVSMNNIYIEGSLNAGARKVMLLARKNVIMNPTRVIGTVEEQTRLKADTTNGGTTLSVTDADNFRVGDCIEIKTTNNAPQRRVTAINAVTDVLTVDLPLTSTIYPAGKVIQSVRDPWFNNNQPYNQNAIRIGKFTDVVQRRLYLPKGTNQVRLAFRHNGERKDALTISAVAPTLAPNSPTLNSALLENKLVATPRQTVMEGNEKALKILFDQSPGSTGTDIFPDASPTPPPPDQATAIGIRLEDMATQMTTRHPLTQWNYTATVNNNYNAGTGTRRPLFYFLAGVGNRFDWVNTSTLPMDPTSKKGIKDQTYAVPMGTSVWAMMNGANATLRKFDSILTSDVDVSQFGFNPNYDGTTATAAREDVLTTDQGFYSSGTGSPTSTIYNVMQTVDSSNYTLDPRQLVYTRPSGLPNDGVDTLVLRLNNSVVPGTNPAKTVEEYFDATPPPANADIPFYRFAGAKVENVVASNDVDEIVSINPVDTVFNVQAYVYAQEGSWFIIPGADFDSKIKSNYLDLNSNGTQDAGETLDLNRDGQVTRDENIAAYRYARYNYSVNFKGAIMENQTANVNDPDGAGVLIGQVSDWTDKWATSKIDFSSGTQVNNFGTVSYSFDPDAADGDLDNDPGFHPPISPELLYQTG